MNEYRDLEILGAGKQPGGRYGKVLIAGSGKIEGDTVCESCSIPGSGKVEGNLTVNGPFSCYGAGKTEGSLQADQLDVYGSMKVEGPCEVRGKLTVAGSFKAEGGLSAERLDVAGVCAAEGGIRVKEAEIRGVLKSAGDVQAEHFRADGSVKIEGLLNAESVELYLEGDDEIESIGGGVVKVSRKSGGFRLFRRQARLLSALIEADEIDIEYTDCEVVRGVNVHIGPECVIDRVEYSGTLTTDANCTIREKVKI